MTPARCLALPAFLLSAALTPLAAGRGTTVDLVIARVELNQTVQDGFAPMTGNRTCFVRATVKLLGAPSGSVSYDGLMRVYVNGQETPDSPHFSKNGPIPAKSLADLAIENDTLNFQFLPPVASNVVVTVEINPQGPNFVAEINYANNVKSSVVTAFGCLGVPELAFVPIDYRPSGGAIPNLPDPLLIEPGMGDNFVQGIYPARDWNYHRTDAPSKLWTQSVAGSGSSLLAALDVDLLLMNPKPDFLYGFIPGGISYNGQSMINGHVSMGNTEAIRYQRTLAHEMGHNTGLNHNTVQVNLLGIDVERHLSLPLGLGTVKPTTSKDIMYAGLLTHEAWVSMANYEYFSNHQWFQCSKSQSAGSGGDERIVISGLLDHATDSIDVLQALSFAAGETTAPAPNANLVVRAFANGALVTEVPIHAGSSRDTCDDCRDSKESATDSGGAPDSLAPFLAVLPASAADGSPVDKVTVTDPNGGAVVTLDRSANAPSVAFRPIVLVPGSEGAQTVVKVAWQGADADGDALKYYLLYRPFDGRIVPLATDVTDGSFDVDLSKLPAPGPQATFELLASDGLRTTSTSTSLATPAVKPKLGVGNAPWVHILTPDPATVWLRGSSVILHGNAFDLEDRMLDGASLEWRSDVDGVIGHGRLITATDLTLGVHVVTLEARDLSNTLASDTVTITIQDRGLPSVGTPTCQQDLGFQGPGTAVLSVCGGDLSSGTTADLELSGAAASQLAFVLAGASNTPTPTLGGMVVPVPFTLLLSMPTDGTGGLVIPGVPGGGGPLSIYAQVVYVDPTEFIGYGISNALQIDLLP